MVTQHFCFLHGSKFNQSFVSSRLNKKEANIFGQFLSLQQQFNIIFLIHGCFMTFVSVRDLFLKVKKTETGQMFFEDCVAPR